MSMFVTVWLVAAVFRGITGGHLSAVEDVGDERFVIIILLSLAWDVVRLWRG